jgi:hypothetical protein
MVEDRTNPETYFCVNGDWVKADPSSIMFMKIDHIQFTEDQNLNVRVQNSLSRSGIVYLGEMMTVSAKSLKENPFLKPKLAESIEAYFSKAGIGFSSLQSFLPRSKMSDVMYDKIQDHRFGQRSEAIQAILVKSKVEYIGTLCQMTQAQLTKMFDRLDGRVAVIAAYLETLNVELGMRCSFTPTDPEVDRKYWQEIEAKIYALPPERVQEAFDLAFNSDHGNRQARNQWKDVEQDVYELPKTIIAAGKFLEKHQALSTAFLEALKQEGVINSDQIETLTLRNVTNAFKNNADTFYPARNEKNEFIVRIAQMLNTSPELNALVGAYVEQVNLITVDFKEKVSHPLSIALAHKI